VGALAGPARNGAIKGTLGGRSPARGGGGPRRRSAGVPMVLKPYRGVVGWGWGGAHGGAGRAGDAGRDALGRGQAARGATTGGDNRDPRGAPGAGEGAQKDKGRGGGPPQVPPPSPPRAGRAAVVNV